MRAHAVPRGARLHSPFCDSVISSELVSRTFSLLRETRSPGARLTRGHRTANCRWLCEEGRLVAAFSGCNLAPAWQYKIIRAWKRLGRGFACCSELLPGKLQLHARRPAQLSLLGRCWALTSTAWCRCCRSPSPRTSALLPHCIPQEATGTNWSRGRSS